MKKDYIKLIGSIICALSVIITVGLVTIGAQADDKTIAYVENVTYSADNKAPETPAGYEGYLFAGWYVEGGENKNDAGYSPVTNPVEGEAYYAKYVPAKVLGVKAQVSTQITDNETDKIQNNSVDNVIRFVTSLDSTEYKHIGFNIKIEDTSYNQDAATTKNVYTTIYGIGAEKDEVWSKEDGTQYFPKDVFHKESVYFKTYAFTTIPEAAFDSDITVTPYWITLDGTRVNGTTTAVKTVNYCRAWVYVDNTGTVTNADAPVGTYSNPYSDLQTALDVDGQTLIPKVILKSDYELSAGVTASQALTLASVKDENVKSIKRAETWTAGHILTVGSSDGGANVTLEDITIDGVKIGAGVNVINGTLLMKDGSTITNGKAAAGANVRMGVSSETKTDGNLIMEEGSVISGGSATGTSTSTQYRGGNVLLQKGTLTINGGTIEGGTATGVKDSTKSNTGCGGNIHSYAGGTIELIKGTISEGTVSSPTNIASTGIGGNICSAGTVTISGGTISDGRATSTNEAATTVPIGCGGNIFSTGTVNVTGGTITGGSATSITATSVSPSVTITVDEESTVYEGNIGCGGNIYSTKTINVSGGTISAGTAANGGNIYSTATLNVEGGTIQGNAIDSTETITNATIGGGNIYTSGTMNMTGGTITGGRAVSTDPQWYQGIGGNICAAGIDADNYANVTITGGTIVDGYVNGRGGNIDAHQYANLELGSEDATSNDLAVITEGTVENTLKNANGGNIFARGDSTFTMYNGVTIKDGTVTDQGGNIFFDSSKTFAINGGVVQNGTAREGGNICFSAKPNGTIAGGTISGGTATEEGGSIYNQGILTLSKGTITGGTATTHGGNIYVTKTLNVTGGEISGGTATGNGGNIFLNAGESSGSTMTMSGGLIDGGTAVKGGSIYITRGGQTTNEDGTYTSNPATLTMTGGTIQNGFATGTGANNARHGGGNIWCTGEFIMNGGTIQGGTTNYRGGNIFVERGSVVTSAPYPFGGKITINAGSILNGASATSRGGNIMLDHALMELGGTGVINITGGKRDATLDENGKATTDENGVIAGTDSNVDMYKSDTKKIQILGALQSGSQIGISGSNTSFEFAEIGATVEQTATEIIALNVFICELNSGHKTSAISASSDDKGLTYTTSTK